MKQSDQSKATKAKRPKQSDQSRATKAKRPKQSDLIKIEMFSCVKHFNIQYQMEEQKKIFYTGIGCNETTFHTTTEFLEIMRRHFTDKNWEKEYDLIPKEEHYQLEYKMFDLPDDFQRFTLEDWLDYSGAIMK